ncbi:MAG: hypothetical protein AAF825_00100 [Pseudomonadota bacterium]
MALPGLALGTGVLWAADGFEGQLTVGQRLEYENDSGTTRTSDEGMSSQTSLGLNVTTETRTQRLSFGLSGNLRAKLSGTSADDDVELLTPRATLSYAMEARGAALTLNGGYQRSDIDDSTFLSDPLDPDSDIVTGEGDRARLTLSTELELGRDAPFGATFSYFRGETRYSGTVDPSLVDIETDEFGLDLRFDINEQLQMTLEFDSERTDAAGPGSNDRDEDRVRLGMRYDLRPDLQVTAGLSYTEIETDDNAGTITSTDGLGYDLGLTREVLNGTYGLSFSESETVNGKRRQFFINRDLSYARGELSLQAGLTKTDGLSTEPLISATASYEIDAVSGLNLSLSQSSNVNDNNEESINTRLSLGYNRDLSDLSTFSADFSLVDRNAQTGAGADTTSTRINLQYNYELGDGLNLTSGYRYTKTEETGQPDEKNTVLFLGLEKTFDF